MSKNISGLKDNLRESYEEIRWLSDILLVMVLVFLIFSDIPGGYQYVGPTTATVSTGTNCCCRLPQAPRTRTLVLHVFQV